MSPWPARVWAGVWSLNEGQKGGEQKFRDMLVNLKAVCASRLRLPVTGQGSEVMCRLRRVVPLVMQTNEEDNSLQCADIHIYMVDGGHVDEACQLTAAAVINDQAQVIVDLMTSIIDDRVGRPHLKRP